MQEILHIQPCKLAFTSATPFFAVQYFYSCLIEKGVAMKKHLSLSERAIIEKCIAQDMTFASIGRKLERSPSTISREILKHRVFVDKEPPDSSRECIHYFSCIHNRICHSRPTYSCMDRCKFCSEADCRRICRQYESSHCSLLEKPPYVCTGCPSIKSCRKNHAYYTAIRADAASRRELSQSRSGLHSSPEDLKRISEIISPLIKRGQSLNHIYATHRDEIGVSERTLYNYIDSNIFHVRNVDLPKKVVYRNRRKKKVSIRMEYKYREGRTYADFNAFMEMYPNTAVVEMDTVKSARGCTKSLLTLIFPQSSFMLVFLMAHATEKCVLSVFDYLTRLIGVDTFHRLFPVILTDNGVEFKDPDALEFSENGCRRTHIFYCDPMASWQKPHVEKNHVLIRRCLPKGTSFASLTQADVHLMVCHLNSYARELLDNKTPFALMKNKEQKKLLAALNLSPVPPDEVILSPAIFKH